MTLSKLILAAIIGTATVNQPVIVPVPTTGLLAPTHPEIIVAAQHMLLVHDMLDLPNGSSVGYTLPRVPYKGKVWTIESYQSVDTVGNRWLTMTVTYDVPKKKEP